MKLAFCLFRYSKYGGMQRYFHAITNACLERGHTIDIYTYGWQGDKPDNLNIIIIPAYGLTNHARNANFVRKSLPHIKYPKYDLVVGFDKMPGLDIYYAADTCFKLRAAKNHNIFYRLTSRYRQMGKFEDDVFSYKHDTHIMYLADKQYEEYQQCYGTPKRRFHLLPPGIKQRYRELHKNHNSTEIFNIRNKQRQQLGLTKKDAAFLMVASSFRSKGVDRAIRALAQIPDFINKQSFLFVIGRDKPKRYLRLAKKLKIANQVRFLGAMDDVIPLYLAADALIHPARNENTGNVILEALVTGLPVICTANCGYAKYVKKVQAGIIIPEPFSQAALDKAILAIWSPNHRNMWQENALLNTQFLDIYDRIDKAVEIIESSAVQHVDPACRNDIKGYFDAEKNLFPQIMELEGELYKDFPSRKTSRVKLGPQHFFIKKHLGVGYREIIKNLLNFKLPILSAKNEYFAIKRIEALNIPTMTIAGFDVRGSNPARLKSYLLTDELPESISLENLAREWRETAPPFNFKKEIILEVARIAKLLHRNGLNHRDLYICHFLLDTECFRNKPVKIYLIDLHRMQIRAKTPTRWIVKDLAALHFSSLDIGLTRNDILRFIKAYSDRPLREVLSRHIWHKVKKRSAKFVKRANK